MRNYSVQYFKLNFVLDIAFACNIRMAGTGATFPNMPGEGGGVDREFMKSQCLCILFPNENKRPLVQRST